MTTPLGALSIEASKDRRASVSRETRETTVAISLDLDGEGTAVDRDRCRVLRPPAVVARPPRPVRPRGPDPRRSRRRRAPHRRGHRARPWRRVRGGARRPSRHRPLRRRDRADGRVARDGGRRHRRAAVRRRRAAVPRRARRGAAAPARRARDRGVRPDGRRDDPRPGQRPERPPPGRGRVQGARPGAARRLRAGSASPGSGLDEGLARVSGVTPTRSGSLPRFAVVDYGAGNLVSIEQALVSVGAAVVRATGPDDLRDADALVVPGVGAAAPAMERLERAGPRRADPALDRRRPAVPRDLPRPPAALRGQRRGRRGDARRPAGPDATARGRPVAPPHRLEPGRAPARPPGVRRDPPTRPTSTSSTRTPAAPADRAPATTSCSRRRPTAGRSCRPSRGVACSASSSTPSGAATTGCGCSRTSSPRFGRRASLATTSR